MGSGGLSVSAAHGDPSSESGQGAVEEPLVKGMDGVRNQDPTCRDHLYGLFLNMLVEGTWLRVF